VTTAPTIPTGLKAWLAGKGLTPRERDVVSIYVQLREAGDGVIGPTQAEIADVLGIARSSMHEHIGKLVGKGVFKRANHRRAGMRLLWDERAEDGGEANLRTSARLAVREMRSMAKMIEGNRPALAEMIRFLANRLDAAVDDERRDAK